MSTNPTTMKTPKTKILAAAAKTHKSEILQAAYNDSVNTSRYAMLCSIVNGDIDPQLFQTMRMVCKLPLASDLERIGRLRQECLKIAAQIMSKESLIPRFDAAHAMRSLEPGNDIDWSINAVVDLALTMGWVPANPELHGDELLRCHAKALQEAPGTPDSKLVFADGRFGMLMRLVHELRSSIKSSMSRLKIHTPSHLLDLAAQRKSIVEMRDLINGPAKKPSQTPQGAAPEEATTPAEAATPAEAVTPTAAENTDLLAELTSLRIEAVAHLTHELKQKVLDVCHMLGETPFARRESEIWGMTRHHDGLRLEEENEDQQMTPVRLALKSATRAARCAIHGVTQGPSDTQLARNYIIARIHSAAPWTGPLTAGIWPPVPGTSFATRDSTIALIRAAIQGFGSEAPNDIGEKWSRALTELVTGSDFVRAAQPMKLSKHHILTQLSLMIENYLNCTRFSSHFVEDNTINFQHLWPFLGVSPDMVPDTVVAAMNDLGELLKAFDKGEENMPARILASHLSDDAIEFKGILGRILGIHPDTVHWMTTHWPATAGSFGKSDQHALKNLRRLFDNLNELVKCDYVDSKGSTTKSWKTPKGGRQYMNMMMLPSCAIHIEWYGLAHVMRVKIEPAVYKGVRDPSMPTISGTVYGVAQQPTKALVAKLTACLDKQLVALREATHSCTAMDERKKETPYARIPKNQQVAHMTAVLVHGQQSTGMEHQKENDTLREQVKAHEKTIELLRRQLTEITGQQENTDSDEDTDSDERPAKMPKLLQTQATPTLGIVKKKRKRHTQAPAPATNDPYKPGDTCLYKFRGLIINVEILRVLYVKGIDSSYELDSYEIKLLDGEKPGLIKSDVEHTALTRIN